MCVSLVLTNEMTFASEGVGAEKINLSLRAEDALLRYQKEISHQKKKLAQVSSLAQIEKKITELELRENSGLRKLQSDLQENLTNVTNEKIYSENLFLLAKVSYQLFLKEGKKADYILSENSYDSASSLVDDPEAKSIIDLSFVEFLIANKSLDKAIKLGASYAKADECFADFEYCQRVVEILVHTVDSLFELGQLVRASRYIDVSFEFIERYKSKMDSYLAIEVGYRRSWLSYKEDNDERLAASADMVLDPTNTHFDEARRQDLNQEVIELLGSALELKSPGRFWTLAKSRRGIQSNASKVIYEILRNASKAKRFGFVDKVAQRYFAQKKINGT